MTAITLALPARYRGSELIATGGMADVYAATDDTLERRVAIKILNERFAGDPDIRTRFTREARIAARLSVEPNVVTIFDVADVAGQPAIVMEFLPGERWPTGCVRAVSPGACPCLARAGGAGARCRARGGRRPPRRQARKPDARSRRRGARDRFRDRPDRGRRLTDERGHHPRHLRLHVARAGRRRHGNRRKRPLRPWRRRVRAALRPQAVSRRDVRCRSGGACNGADPRGDEL